MGFSVIRRGRRSGCRRSGSSKSENHPHPVPPPEGEGTRMTDTIDGIDIHAHGVPKQFLEEVKRTRLGGVDVSDVEGGYVVTFPGRKPLRPAAGIMLDFTQRLT